MTDQCSAPATLNSKIDANLHRALKIRAAQTGQSMRSLIEDSLRHSLDMHDRACNANELAVETEE